MKTVALGKVAKIDRTVANDDECLSLPYVGLEHVEKERGHFADDFVPTPLNMLATNFRFTPKHVLYGKLRPYLNKVVLPSFDGVCTTEILPILPNEEKLDRTFLWAILLSPTFVNWATSQISGANLPRLDPKLLAEYEIPLPPLTEQKRIASLLARADRLRQLRRTAHNLGDTLLQSVFLEMFGDPITNSRNWKVSAIGEVCNVTKLAGYEYTEHIHYQDAGEIAVVRALNVKNGKLRLDNVKYIDKKTSDYLRRSKLYIGDVVMTYIGVNIGDVAIITENDKYHLAPNVSKITPKDTKKLNPVYLMRFLEFNNSQFSKFTTNTAKQSLNMGNIRELSLPIPPITLQEEFAGVVARVESLRGRMGESTRQVEGLFESLLGQSFDGGQ